MEKRNAIFVPDYNLGEQQIEYSEVIQWLLKNEDHPNVLMLTSDEIYFLDYQTNILNIINEENNSMLQAFEDDWIIEDSIKIKIKDRLEKYALSVLDEKTKFYCNRIVMLLDIAIKNRNYIYFYF